MLLFEGLTNTKRHSHPQSFAAVRCREIDSSAMRMTDVARDGETQPGAVLGRVAAPIEALENAITFVCRNAGTIVLDFHRDSVIAPHAHGDFAAGWRVADRVVDKVDEELVEQQPVAGNHGGAVVGFETEIDLLLARGRHELGRCRLRERSDVDRDHVAAWDALRLGAREYQ